VFIHCAFTFFVLHVCLCQTTLSFVKLSNLANSGSCVHWFDFFHPGKNFVHGSLLRKDIGEEVNWRHWAKIGISNVLDTNFSNQTFLLFGLCCPPCQICVCVLQPNLNFVSCLSSSGCIQAFWKNTSLGIHRQSSFPKRFLQSSLLGRTLDDNNDRVLLDGHLCFTPC